MQLSTLTPLDSAKHFLATAKWPFFVTLVLGMGASLAGGTPAKILVSAFSGQLAITLFKLFTYFALIFLPLAVALRAWPALSRAIHRAGDVVAGLAFIAAAAAAGVSAGLVGGLFIELIWWKALLAAATLALLFVQASVVLWLAAVAPLQSLPVSNIWKGAIATIIAFVVSAFSIASLYCEKWPEVDGLVLSQNRLVCQSLSALHRNK